MLPRILTSDVPCVSQSVLRMSENDVDASLLALLPSADEDVLDAVVMGAFMDNLLLEESSKPSDNHPHIRKRQKDELEYLRNEAAELTKHLELLKTVKATEMEHTENHWEKIARGQKMAAQKATLENSRLKRALEDQLHLATALDRLLAKRPRLAVCYSIMNVALYVL